MMFVVHATRLQFLPGVREEDVGAVCFERGFCVLLPERTASKVLVYGEGDAVDRDELSGLRDDILEKMLTRARFDEVLEKLLPGAVCRAVRNIVVRDRDGQREGYVSVSKDGEWAHITVGDGSTSWTARVDLETLAVFYDLAVREHARQGDRIELWQGMTSRTPLYSGSASVIESFFVGGMETEDDLQDFYREFSEVLEKHIKTKVSAVAGADSRCSCSPKDGENVLSCCCRVEGGEVCFEVEWRAV